MTQIELSHHYKEQRVRGNSLDFVGKHLNREKEIILYDQSHRDINSSQTGWPNTGINYLKQFVRPRLQSSLSQPQIGITKDLAAMATSWQSRCTRSNAAKLNQLRNQIFLSYLENHGHSNQILIFILLKKNPKQPMFWQYIFVYVHNISLTFSILKIEISSVFISNKSQKHQIDHKKHSKNEQSLKNRQNI